MEGTGVSDSNPGQPWQLWGWRLALCSLSSAAPLWAGAGGGPSLRAAVWKQGTMFVWSLALGLGTHPL